MKKLVKFQILILILTFLFFSNIAFAEVYRNQGAPYGILPQTTTSAKLLFHTDDSNAVCKYSLEPGIDYDSIPIENIVSKTYNAFNNPLQLTGGQYARTFNNLVPSDYAYYIRCVNGEGIKNNDDYVITFSIASGEIKPELSVPRIVHLTDKTATIVWYSSVPSKPQLSYGLTTNYENTTQVNNSLSTIQIIYLTNLTPGTKYYFKSRSTSIDGTITDSIGQEFTTLSNYQLLGADIINNNRRIDWDPGIPGGIPSYPVSFNVKEAPFFAKGDGINDDTQAIQNAIDMAPAGTAVLLPQGNYNVSKNISLNQGVVLRGEGKIKTRIIFIEKSNPGSGSNQRGISMQGSGSSSNAFSRNILSGLEKGSTRIVVENTNNLSIGSHIVLDQLNDGNLVNIRNYVGMLDSDTGSCTYCSRDSGARALGQIGEVTRIDGNVVYFYPGLYMDYSLDLTPQIYYYSSPTEGKFTRFSGVEDLSLDNTFEKIGEFFHIGQSAYCWVKNVEMFNINRGGIRPLYTFRSEYRNNFLLRTNHFQPNGSYGYEPNAQSTANLYENNSAFGVRSPMVFGSGATGNVTAFNYNEYAPDRTHNDMYGGMSLHASHAHMNLFESNKVNKIVSDNIHGSNSNNTFFRNYSRGHQPGTRTAQWAVAIDYGNWYNTLVGNVLGTPGLRSIYEQYNIPYTYYEPFIKIWRIGYVSSGSSNNRGSDEIAYNTLLRHGNYDYNTNSTIWDDNIASRTIPTSLYLKTKPSFLGSTTWPSIGPDVSNQMTITPSEQRVIDAKNTVCGNGKIERVFVDIIVDDSDTSFSTNGEWNTIPSTSPQVIGNSYVEYNSSEGDPTKYVMFTPNIEKPGLYRVFATWVSQWNDPRRPDAVPFIVNHANGSYEKIFNQKTTYSSWQLMGTFYFEAGTQGNVKVLAASPGVTAADAVKFESMFVEECDDGGTSSGDGCSQYCKVESGWKCTGEPSTCTYSGTPNNICTTYEDRFSSAQIQEEVQKWFSGINSLAELLKRIKLWKYCPIAN